jgi:hypothetical protein
MNETAEDRARATAREYFRTRGTQAPVSTIRARVAAAFESVEATVAPLDADVAARRPPDGAWSVQEIVDHLLETHRASLDELWCLLADQRPPGPPVPAGLQSKAPLRRPWPWLVRELRSVHRDVLAALDGVAPGFTTDARAALVMVVNVEADGATAPLTWIEDLDWKAYTIVYRLHALDHLRQAKRSLLAVRAAGQS